MFNQQVITPTFDPFDDEAMSTPAQPSPTAATTGTPPANNDATPAAVPAANTDTTPSDPPPTAVPTVDYNTYLKEQFGFDTPELANEQIAKWKEMKPYEEPKFANDESKKLYENVLKGDKKEILTILAKQQALENLTTGEINEKTAPEIVKMAMRTKYPALSEEQIQYKFNKQFATAPQPVQGIDELDNDFESRKQTWQQQVNDAKQDLLIEAGISKPELEKLKSELQLPDIFGQNQQQAEPTAEEKAQWEALANANVQSVENALNKFDGFNVTVKDGEVEIPVAYSLSKEEKAEVQQILSSTIREADANPFLGKRWFDKDGNPKSEQMIKDITRMLYGDKIEQKFANESSAKRLEAKMKENSNLSLNQNPQGTFTPPAPKKEHEKVADFVWENS